MTIHALPGMGADRRMFPVPWDTLEPIRFHDWRRCADATSIADVAHRVAEEGDIRDGDLIVGASLGGMVACEISRIRRIPRLVLVGSALSNEEIHPVLVALRSWSDTVPLEWLRLSAGKIPGELAGMFADADPTFIRSMCRCIFAWSGGASPDTEVVRIHGRHDLVIPPPARAELLLDGGHLISLTHAQACVDFIRGLPGFAAGETRHCCR